ncbi:MAG: hypothetical protein KDA84_23100, partial [Planctomycetaceae bacterium]|nr:hypothetical protein [Planctomycetaceae bacterium]
KFRRLVHVVDYYYKKASLTLPQPHTVDCWAEWLLGGSPFDAVAPLDTPVNKLVLRQILLHLDCDGVEVFQLNDIRNFLINNPTPKRLGYGYIVSHCFVAMRRDEV